MVLAGIFPASRFCLHSAERPGFQKRFSHCACSGHWAAEVSAHQDLTIQAGGQAVRSHLMTADHPGSQSANEILQSQLLETWGTSEKRPHLTGAPRKDA